MGQEGLCQPHLTRQAQRMELALFPSQTSFQTHQVWRQSFLVFAPDHKEAVGFQADQ